MNKIITSEESDIDLDPESIMDPIVETFSAAKGLEAIRDLEQLITNAETLGNNLLFEQSTKQEKNIPCMIKFKSRQSRNAYITSAYLSSLNQTVIERNITEIELTGDDKKLIQLFAFYQNNIFKKQKFNQKNAGPLKILLRKKISKRRKRKVVSKNDVLVQNFYVEVKNKKIDLIDIREQWKVNEMKYSFDNNRSKIRILLVRSK